MLRSAIATSIRRSSEAVRPRLTVIKRSMSGGLSCKKDPKIEEWHHYRDNLDQVQHGSVGSEIHRPEIHRPSPKYLTLDCCRQIYDIWDPKTFVLTVIWAGIVPYGFYKVSGKSPNRFCCAPLRLSLCIVSSSLKPMA